jgi:hypothetical protein
MTWETAVALAGGRSFDSCTIVAIGLLEEESLVVYPLLDPQKTSYSFGYSSLWSLGGLVHAPGGGRLPLPRLRLLLLQLLACKI